MLTLIYLTYIVVVHFLTILKGVIMNTPKLCIDCKHLKDRICHHPATGIDLVYGGIRTESAAVMRLDSQLCKPKAIFFEPMEPVIYDLAALFPDVNFPNIKGETK